MTENTFFFYNTLNFCFFPFISQTYYRISGSISTRFFLLYREQEVFTVSLVFLLFPKQVCRVFLLYRKQVGFMSVSFFLLFPKQACWRTVRIFLLFRKHHGGAEEKNPAVVGRRIDYNFQWLPWRAGFTILKSIFAIFKACSLPTAYR